MIQVSCGSKSSLCLAITKNGIVRLTSTPPLDSAKYKTDKKVTDPEIIKILEQPLSKSSAGKNKNKKKKKKPSKKAAAGGDEDEDESSSEE